MVQRGFTLIELLITLAMIALLTALLLAGLGAARQRASSARCISNLKQIAVALRLYTDDANDIAPMTADPENPFHALSGFKPLLGKYVGSSTEGGHPLFDCPADRFHYNELSLSPALVRHGLNQERSAGFSSYGFNGGNATGLLNASGIAGRKLASLTNPSRIPFALENSGFIPWSWHRPRKPLGPAHALFSNALNGMGFADGHVAMVAIYWKPQAQSFAMQQTPPADYAYQWAD